MFAPQTSSNGQTLSFTDWMAEVVSIFALNGKDIHLQAEKYGNLGFRYDYELGETPRQAYFNEVAYWEE